MLFIKAFHIIAIVAWFAGLFYLPRLFVYHTQAKGWVFGCLVMIPVIMRMQDGCRLS